MATTITLSSTYFAAVRDKFFQTVNGLPVTVKIYVETIVADTDEYEQFNRSQQETYGTVDVKCLYKREISNRERQKYGIKDDVTAIIYIAPDALVTALGTFTPDSKKLLFRFSDYEKNALYEVDKVVYLEPLYNSCIAVMYQLKSTTKQVDELNEDPGGIIVPPPSGGSGTIDPIEVEVGSAEADLLNIYAGDSTVTHNGFINHSLQVFLQHTFVPGKDKGDGSIFYTHVKTTNVISLGSTQEAVYVPYELQDGDWIKIIVLSNS